MMKDMFKNINILAGKLLCKISVNLSVLTQMHQKLLFLCKTQNHVSTSPK